MGPRTIGSEKEGGGALQEADSPPALLESLGTFKSQIRIEGAQRA